MRIEQAIDIEDEARKALAPYMTAYCRPLPAEYVLPNVLITLVGGTEDKHISTFEVVLDARAEREAAAMQTLQTAIGALKAVAREQTTKIRYVAVNSIGSWGADPVRPDLAMCSARLSVTAHNEITEIMEV